MTDRTLAERLAQMALSGLMVVFVVAYIPAPVSVGHGAYIAGTYVAHHARARS